MNELKPLLLIDVDGVLNPEFSPHAWRKRKDTEGWGEYTVLGFRVYLNREHGKLLLDAAREAGAELAWASTWNDLANQHVAPLTGLPELPVFFAAMGNKPSTVLPAVAGRKFVWLDDEPYVIKAAEEAGGHGVWVHPRTGLAKYHLSRAVSLLNET